MSGKEPQYNARKLAEFIAIDDNSILTGMYRHYNSKERSYSLE